MADLTYSMLFKADAAQATAAIGGLTQAADQLAAGVTAAGAASAAAGADMAAVTAEGAAGATAALAASNAHAEHASAVQMLRAAVQPMVGEFYALQEAVRTVTQLEDAGALTAHEAALAHDLLARQATELSGRMQAAGVSVDGTTAAISRQATALQTHINRLTGVDTATDQSTAEQLQYGASLDQLRAKYNPLFAASRQYELVLGEIAEAERLGAISTMEAANARERASASLVQMPQQIGASSSAASAYVGQLTFQLNDIGMMLASGQSPFMLMVQQGPQVAQVFGQMRQAGMALGPAIAGAFRMMLNPIGLLTIAAIGGAAVFVQWLTDTETGAEKAVGELDDLEAALGGLNRALSDIEAYDFDNIFDGMESSSLQIRQQFDAILKVVDEVQAASLQLQLTEAKDVGTKGLQDEIISNSYQADIAGRTGADAPSFEYMGLDSLYEAEFVLRSIYEIEGQTREEILRSVNATTEKLYLMGLMTPEVQRVLATMAQELGLSEQIKSAVEDSNAAHANTTVLVDAATARVGEMVNGLGSALGAMTAMVAAAPGGGWLSGAISQAGALAGQLWNAATAAAAARTAENALSTMKFEFSAGGQALMRYGSRAPGGTSEQNAFADRYAPPPVISSGTSGVGSGSNGGGGGARVERDALRDLIETQEEQIAALRATDPVQKEIQKNHEALAKATDEERKQVEANIRTRLRLSEIQSQLDEIGKAGERAFTGLVTGAHSFSDALSMMLDKLAEMAASSAWDILWSGGSGGGGGGGLSSIVGGLLGGGDGFFSGNGDLFNNVVGKADGGVVSGKGGPRDDRVLIRTSPGEYIVNAAQTARHLPLIEAINNGASVDQMMAIIGGSRPAFADGGIVGALTGSAALPSSRPAGLTASSPSGSASNAQVGVRIYFDSRKADWTAEVQRISGSVSAEMVREGIGMFSDQMLPDRIAEIDSNPRMRG